MRYALNVFRANLLKDIKYLQRYAFNTIFGILFLFIVFWGISYGVKVFGTNYSDGITKNLLSGYVVWLLMTTNFSSIVNNLINETALGTLEQLYINSKSFFFTIILKALSSFFISYIQLSVIILLIATVSPDLNISFFYMFIIILPLTLVGISSIWGISIVLCSLILKYKNVGSLYNAISSVLFAGVTYGVHSSEIITYIFPFGLTNLKIQEFFISHSLPSALDITVIITNSIGYLIFGYYFLFYFIKKAKQKGQFSHH